MKETCRKGVGEQKDVRLYAPLNQSNGSTVLNRMYEFFFLITRNQYVTFKKKKHMNLATLTVKM